MSTYTVNRTYVLSSTGKSKMLTFEVTHPDGSVVAAYSSQKKAEVKAEELNAARIALVEGGSGEEEPQVEEAAAPGTVVVPEKESPAQEARRKAHELGFSKYAIRRYRYYQHLVGDEHMKEEDAKAAAATATRHTLWPFRMTREELRASA